MQIAAHAGFAALPDHFGHNQLGLSIETVIGQHTGQHGRADEDHVALRNGDRLDTVVTRRQRRASDQRVDETSNVIGELALLVPQADDRRLLALAAIREVPVARNQTEQHAQRRAALGAKLAFARLHPQLVTDLQLRQLELASGRVELVPGRGLDLIALGCGDVENLSLACAQKGRNGCPRDGAALLLAQRPFIHGDVQGLAAGTELVDAD